MSGVVSQIVAKTKGDIATDRVLTAAKQSITTGSVQVLQPPKHRHTKQQKEEDSSRYRIVRVTTSCTLPIINEQPTDCDVSEIRINIQPLVVLDLNGILCHRIRRQRSASFDRKQEMSSSMIDYPFRSQLGPDIAQTPIIPRPDLSTFLEYLDQHFCLAVWTSAKIKTAKQLISLLIPTAIRNRLLFVWAQGQCETRLVPSSSSSYDDQSPEKLFIKNLNTVWQRYPIWNTHNTLLIDDSPEKCIYYKENAIHPPSLHGRQIHPGSDSNLGPLSDEVNATRQLAFMKMFVQHWNEAPVTHVWDSRNNTDVPVSMNDPTRKNDMKSFLIQHATGDLGYPSST